MKGPSGTMITPYPRRAGGSIAVPATLLAGAPHSGPPAGSRHAAASQAAPRARALAA